MRVLGIESSCDETAAALVTETGEVLADVVASQIATHGPYGGIVPELASRAHMRAIIPVVREALASSPSGLRGIDAIAVTRGPGLVGSLLVGVQVAKALAWSVGKPLIGVNHLDGHLLAVYLWRPGQEGSRSQPTMPYVALLVSGGHTALYRVESPADILLLAQTRDDAAGEAFDKAGKLLGLGYPGGPLIDRLAAGGNPEAFSFPVPMGSRKTLDFSFSGLKTALARQVQQHGVPDDQKTLADICASFQGVIVDSLVRKSILACQREGLDRLVITGGVAANRGLRA
ncbi:MAG: tRNA (adenosine(37)-N6)-threonylcarbamoyltransferase complex transferase subunit TsaD, partial [Polyangiales bacterium]